MMTFAGDRCKTVFTRSDGTESYYFNSQLFTKFMWAVCFLYVEVLTHFCPEQTSVGVMYALLLYFISQSATNKRN